VLALLAFDLSTFRRLRFRTEFRLAARTGKREHAMPHFRRCA
jgi:hypothetical protein